MSNQYLKLRRSSVPGKTPDTASLDFGEIALNTYDGLAFMKKSGSSGEEIVTIGSTVGAFTGSFSGSFTGSLEGTASWSINSTLLSGLDSGSFAVTSSNIFRGIQIITGSNGTLIYDGNITPNTSLAEVHAANDNPWLLSLSSSSPSLSPSSAAALAVHSNMIDEAIINHSSNNATTNNATITNVDNSNNTHDADVSMASSSSPSLARTSM